MTEPKIVYTDGACVGNPGPGGWAWVCPSGECASGSVPASTNQRMELTAVIEALAALEGPLEIRSDSAYVVNCFLQRWYDGWRRKGWRNSKKEPVANRDLWEPLIDAVLVRGDVTFVKVTGHVGDYWNERADELAEAAAAAAVR
jgi:ribonuclease HI